MTTADIGTIRPDTLTLNSVLDTTSSAVQFAEIKEGVFVPNGICLR